MGMPNIKLWGLLAIAISPVIVNFSGWELAKAELTQELLISVDFPSGPERKKSGRTSGGGTRGPKNSLTALIPADDLVTTVANNPKFFMYIPQHEANLALFEIYDDQLKIIYSTNLDISETSGIVKISLPDNVNLRTDKEYNWSFTILYDPEGGDRSGDPIVSGIVKKVELSSDLKNSLKNASPLQQAQIYANAKIWNETIATLAELRTSNPTEWEGLLKSVGLTEIASEPFAPCCQVEE